MIDEKRSKELDFLIRNDYPIIMILDNEQKREAGKTYKENYDRVFSDIPSDGGLTRPDIFDDFYTIIEMVYLGVLDIYNLDTEDVCGHFFPTKNFLAYNGERTINVKKGVLLTIPLDSSTIDKLSYFTSQTNGLDYDKF